MRDDNSKENVLIREKDKLTKAFKREIRHKKRGVSAVFRQPGPWALAQEAHEGLSTIKRRRKTLIATVARLLQYTPTL